MKRLQTQLILAFSLVILVVLCGVSTALLLLLRQNPQEDRAIYAELNTQAQILVRLLMRPPWLSPGFEERETRLLEIAQAQDIRVGWASADGEVRFDSEHRWDRPDAEALFPRLNRVRDGRWLGRVREGNRTWLVLAYPIPRSDDSPVERSYLILARPTRVIAFLQQFRQSIARPLIQAGLLAFAVGLILALIISGSIARPLRQVSDTAKAIAQGDLDARAPESGPAEVRQMAHAFNQMAEQVQVSRQSQQDLVANIAHDLRTPLTSVQGFAQALIDGTAESSSDQTRAARAIYEESKRINKMTASLLDLARLESGQIEIERELVDLVALVETRTRRLEPLADGKQIDVQYPEGNTQINVLGDEARLSQVVDNLLSNAMQYTDVGDRITVSLVLAEDTVSLCVADTGMGIPEAELSRVFERFYRGDKSRRGDGTGLGLAIVREIVEAHNGTITVESVVGVGTRFLITLPTP